MNIYECYDITILMFLNMLNENLFGDFKDYKFIINNEVYKYIPDDKYFVMLANSDEDCINAFAFDELNDIITVLHIVGENTKEGAKND